MTDACQAIVQYSNKEQEYFFRSNGLAQLPHLPQPMALPYMAIRKILRSDWFKEATVVVHTWRTQLQRKSSVCVQSLVAKRFHSILSACGGK